MVKSTNGQATKNEYNRVRAKPFTRIQGRPKRADWDLLRREACTLAITVRVPAYDAWAGDHGILAEIIGGPAYLAKTTKQYIALVRPTAHNPSIRANTSEFAKSKKTEEWEDLKESHAVLVAARLGIAENICDAC